MATYTASTASQLTNLSGASSPLKPGDTLLVRNILKGTFVCQLIGTEAQPITVRSHPTYKGRIDGGIVTMGPDTTFTEIEVFNSSTNRNVSRPTGIDVHGVRTKVVGNIIHDTGNGIGLWSQAVNAEASLNTIYNCGMNIPGYAHGIYVQNESGTKLLKDNIIFNNFGYGIHAYGERGSLKGISLEGNISFNNGILSAEKHFQPNIQVGGSTPAEDISLVRNLTYQGGAASRGANLQLYYRSRENGDLTLTDNYFAGGNLEVQWWKSIQATGNTFLTDAARVFIFGLPVTYALPNYKFSKNRYVYLNDGTPFEIEGGGQGTFTQWQQGTGFDLDSTFSNQRPTKQDVIVRQTGLKTAHVVVYNWPQLATATVDLSTLLKSGETFEVRDAQNPLGVPYRGTYNGAITLSLKNAVVAKPIGYPGVAHTSPVFNVFTVKGV